MEHTRTQSPMSALPVLLLLISTQKLILVKFAQPINTSIQKQAHVNAMMASSNTLSPRSAFSVIKASTNTGTDINVFSVIPARDINGTVINAKLSSNVLKVSSTTNRHTDVNVPTNNTGMGSTVLPVLTEKSTIKTLRGVNTDALLVRFGTGFNAFPSVAMDRFIIRLQTDVNVHIL